MEDLKRQRERVKEHEENHSVFRIDFNNLEKNVEALEKEKVLLQNESNHFILTARDIPQSRFVGMLVEKNGKFIFSLKIENECSICPIRFL